MVAVGRLELIRGEWITEGAVVIDAGYNPGNVRDVEYGPAAERASLISPVPGGVGPMPIAVLLDQTLAAAQARLIGRDLLTRNPQREFRDRHTRYSANEIPLMTDAT